MFELELILSLCGQHSKQYNGHEDFGVYVLKFPGDLISSAHYEFHDGLGINALQRIETLAVQNLDQTTAEAMALRVRARHYLSVVGCGAEEIAADRFVDPGSSRTPILGDETSFGMIAHRLGSTCNSAKAPSATSHWPQSGGSS
ncbi:hypothetical protein JX265_006850 [Neoarthrinium moseri]|uniref:Uncharacterized protein n=1 Tax=Neoarthrinium moseri TaxID=1658444 RepID=A0A9P9WLF7_9PEZI|nr:uncharacterized protein JN550_002674 [Neoarthrinium moseri]KAI1846953.1 hypothetical protein JX266_006828 [Neoarthrinium moseri]KAI1868871.1 hypothetical protein JX265_006850 [Neoarthrinium moseri]KAI1874095.1 hypothetical protein JN550_002674 [Neoarthrinium moseri]